MGLLYSWYRKVLPPLHMELLSLFHCRKVSVLNSFPAFSPHAMTWEGSILHRRSPSSQHSCPMLPAPRVHGGDIPMGRASPPLTCALPQTRPSACDSHSASPDSCLLSQIFHWCKKNCCELTCELSHLHLRAEAHGVREMITWKESNAKA